MLGCPRSKGEGGAELRFDSETFYSEESLRMAGLDGAALARAREEGLLRFRRVGRRVLYKGALLAEWLGRPETPPAARGGRHAR